MSVLEIVNVAALILIPLVAVWLARYLADRSEKRKNKMEVFKILMISRINSSTLEYVRTVNCIDVIFADSPKVRRAWRALYEQYARPNSAENTQFKFIKLIEEVARDLGYKNLEWDEIIANSYMPQWLCEDLNNEKTYKEGQIKIAQCMLASSPSSSSTSAEPGK